MAFTTPTDGLNSPQASSSGSKGLPQEHGGNILTTLHSEQVCSTISRMKGFSIPLPSPSDVDSSLNVAQAFSYIISYMHRRQHSIPPFLDRQPSVRSQLAALGKLAVLDALPTTRIAVLCTIG
jgi:hypothetical protein